MEIPARGELSDPLIGAAVRPLADNAELRIEAARLLADMLRPAPAASAAALRRWEEIDSRRGIPIWRPVLYAALALVSGWILIACIAIFRNRDAAFGSISFYDSPPKVTDKSVAASLNGSDRLLLFGDFSRGPRLSDRMRALWESEPANPAFFADYALAKLADSGGLPPDFLETARRLDPENSWFTYLAAAALAQNVVSQQPQSAAAKLADDAPGWDIKDAGKMEEILALLRQARGQVRYTDPELEMLRKRLRLLPDRTPAEVIYRIILIASRPDGATAGTRELGAIIAAAAWQAGERKDPAEFREIMADADDFLRKRTNSEVGGVMDELLTRVVAFAAVANLAPAAEKLGLAAESRHLRPLADYRTGSIRAQKERRPNPTTDAIYESGGVAANHLLPAGSLVSALKRPPVLTATDLQPGRMTVADFFAALYSAVAGLFLAICCGAVSLERFRTPILIRRLGARMGQLCKAVDMAWMLVAGVALPAAGFVCVRNFTPLGGLEFNIDRTSVEIPFMDIVPLAFLQFGAAAVLAAILMVVIARWRLAARTRAFDLAPPRSWPGWVAATCAAAFIPLIGWVAVHSSETGVWIACGVALLPLAWLVCASLTALWRNGKRSIHTRAIAGILGPAFAFAALASFAAVPVFHASAGRWFARDLWIRPDPERPAMTTFEHRVAVQMRNELREVMLKP